MVVLGKISLCDMIWMMGLVSASSTDALNINNNNNRRNFLHTVGTATTTTPFGLLWSLSNKPSNAVETANDPQRLPMNHQVAIPGRSAKYNPYVLTSEDTGVVTSSNYRATTNLGQSRLMAEQLSPLQGSISPFADNELYYDNFLFGAWDATATLERKVYPYGPEYLPSKSLFEGSPRYRYEKVGNTTNYEVHYFSTLANDMKNKMTVNLGTGVPKSKIIADRKFNAISASESYGQLAQVQDVDWNPTKDPTRLTFTYGVEPVSVDMMPLGNRRTEVYILARDSETSYDGSTGMSVFCAAERTRSVSLAPGNVLVSDIEQITEFRLMEDNYVKAKSRIAVYLTPNPNSREGILWEQVNGKAVAFFDYDINMKRITENIDGQNRACVKTPKDFVQCY